MGKTSLSRSVTLGAGGLANFGSEHMPSRDHFGQNGARLSTQAFAISPRRCPSPVFPCTITSRSKMSTEDHGKSLNKDTIFDFDVWNALRSLKSFIMSVPV